MYVVLTLKHQVQVDNCLVLTESPSAVYPSILISLYDLFLVYTNCDC